MSADQLNELVEIQSIILELTINDNEAYCSNPNLSPYHSVSAFSLPIKDYLLRYIKYIKFNEVHLIVAQIFLDRYLKSNQQFPLTELNIFRLLAAICHLTHKFCEEQNKAFPLSYYAKVASLSTSETKKLEMKLLADLDFNLFITPALYLEYKMKFVNFGRLSLYRDDGRRFSLSMHPEELAMLEELRLNPLYQPPANADIPIDPNLLADDEVTINVPASATMPAAAAAAASGLQSFFQPKYQIPSYLLSPVISRPNALGTSSLASFSPTNFMTFEPAYSCGSKAATAAVKLPIAAFNSNQGTKTSSQNTSAVELQTLDVDGSNSLPRKKQKITGRAYEPRFLAASSTQVLPSECISDEVSAPNPGRST